MAGFPRSRTLGSFGLALGLRLRTDGSSGSHLAQGTHVRAFGSEGLGYALLGHYGSIEGGCSLIALVGTQRTSCGRVDERRVPRVLTDAADDGSIAVVGIGARRFALQANANATVGA